MTMRLTGKDVKAFRERHSVNRYTLATLIGVEEKTVRAWELSGQRPTGTAWKVLHVLVRGTRGERMLMIGLLNTYKDVGTAVR